MAKKIRSEMIGFRADAEVRAAIEKLTTAIDARGFPRGGARAAAIRRAILDSAARLSSGGEK